MSYQSPAFLARCKTKNHGSNLEEGEIFIIEPAADSKYTGRSIYGHSLVGIFENGDFNKLNLSDGNYAVSVNEYEAAQSGHLSFTKFTLLSIEEVVDNNWYKGCITMDSGKRLGFVGLFPSNVVVMLPKITEIEKQVALVVENLEPKLDGEILLNKGDHVKIIDSHNSWYVVQRSDGFIGTCPKNFLKIVDDPLVFQKTDTTIDPYCTALYDFNGENETEMSFIVGDVIKLTRWVDHEWLEGENQRTRQSGFIPASFVQVIVPPMVAPEMTGDSAQSANKIEEWTTIGIATVLYSFQSRFADELSAEAGTSLKVIANQGDWVKCWNPDTDEIGIIPGSYLRIFSDLDNTSGVYSYPTTSVGSRFDDNDSIDTNEKPWDLPEETKSFRQSMGNLALSDDRLLDKKTTVPPPRPPPPTQKNQSSVQRTAPTRPKSMTKIYAETKSESAGDQTEDGWESQRTKILDEIIQSEQTYLADITAWESAIERNPNLSENRKKQILNGYPMLKYLSRELTASLIAEQTKPTIDQEIGLQFMQHKEIFYKTYGQYFRSAEQVSEILMKGDSRIQRTLQDSVDEMRKNGSSVFDVSTALSRPIQRCLKYPLYLSEIIKNTPLTHPDHPKIMEALKQMGQLATKMNESKRRKELAKKYSRSALEQRDMGFFNRLTKLNLHTLVKKSNRLQYRISTKFGLVTTYQDAEFDQLLKVLEELQQRFCHLIYQMTVYKNRIVRLSKKYVDSNTITKLAPGQEVLTRFEHNNLLRRLLIYAEELNHDIIELCASAHELARRDFTFIVYKRYDKLADWEMAIRSRKSSEIIDMRRCEFEALNNQLKLIFPKEIDKLADGLKKYVKRIKQIDNAFFKRVKNWLEEFKTTTPADFRKYVDPKNLRLRQIENTLRTNTINIFKGSEQIESSSKNCPFDQPSLLYDQPVYGRSQTAEERDKFINMRKETTSDGSFYSVTENYVSDDGKFVLKTGDIIKEKSREGGASIVDNGLATCKIPRHVYGKTEYCDQRSKEESNKQLPNTKIKNGNEKHKQLSIGSTAKRDKSDRESVNWLQYDDVVIDTPAKENFNRPAPAPPEAMNLWTKFDDNILTTDHTKAFGTLYNPVPLEPQQFLPSRFQKASDAMKTKLPPSQTITQTTFPVHQSHEIVQFRSSTQSANNQRQYRKSEPDLLAKLVNEEIARTKLLATAGRRSVSPNTSNIAQKSVNQIPMIPRRDYKVEKAVVGYDFSPSDPESVQLKVREGEIIEILRKHDDANNSDWFLIRNQNGRTGYVPGSFIIPKT
uniref:Dynamin-binding protein n=1 Tax=Panagrolaimus sp. JU765 TaxID=591449 RepID=A0AC34QHH0_9BILA